MLMNWEVGGAAPETKRKVKVVGGRWKDRRRAMGLGKPKEKVSGVNTVAVGEHKPRVSKPRASGGPRDKPRASGGSKEKLRPSAGSTDKPRASGDSPNKHQLAGDTPDSAKPKYVEGPGANGINNTYVSSLFTHDAAPVTASTEVYNALQPLNLPSAGASFETLGLNAVLAAHLVASGFEHPTAIQSAAIPALLAPQDVMVHAQTGLGKTVAFAAPIVSQLMDTGDLHRNSGVCALVLAPTRELAAQTFHVFQQLARCCPYVVPGVVAGGEKKKLEKARLRKGVNVLVGTPGRMLDHIKTTECLDLLEVRWVVLDEGDKLVELGFEEPIQEILEAVRSRGRLGASELNLPARRSHVVCSATIDGAAQRLQQLSLDNAVLVGGSTTELSAPHQLVQQVCVVPPKIRLVALELILRGFRATGLTVVFLLCADLVEFHHRVFSRNAQNVFKLHGGMDQSARTAVVQQLGKAADGSILFCTDVALRGIDLPVLAVVEYDPPFSVEDHLHRVGRTARAGQAGQAVLFLLPGPEAAYADVIAPLHPAGLVRTNHEEVLARGFGSNWGTDATTWHLNVERWLVAVEELKAVAVKAFTSHIRAYATHLASERSMFGVRLLHLGHLAKAFGLRETPRQAGGERGDKKPKKESAALRMAKATLRDNRSDYNLA